MKKKKETLFTFTNNRKNRPEIEKEKRDEEVGTKDSPGPKCRNKNL